MRQSDANLHLKGWYLMNKYGFKDAGENEAQSSCAKSSFQKIGRMPV